MSIRKGTTIIAGNSSPLDWTGTLQEYNIALENGTIKENMVCYITDDTLYTDDIRPEIENLNSVKANKDLSNLSEVGEKHFLNKSQITNCITEIPQNIKLELNNGTITLKAGSKVIVPNGSEVFDELTVSKDLTLGAVETATLSSKLYVKADGSALVQWVGEASGTTAPAGTSAFYNTADNTCKLYTSGTVAHNVSFPIANVHRTNGSWDKIEQIFNGFGYIGSTLWVDKGVKGLIPNGRNEDGTLRNTEVVNNSVKTVTTNYTISDGLVALTAGGVYEISTTTWNYNKEKNIYENSSGVKSNHLVLASASYTNGVISDFQPNQPFRAVNYNEYVNGVGSAKAYIKESYINGTSGYRVWSDKYCEQWGKFTQEATAETTITLLKAYSNTNYIITKTFEGGYTSLQVQGQYLSIGSKTTTNFKTKTYNTDGLTTFTWKAEGYIN